MVRSKRKTLILILACTALVLTAWSVYVVRFNREFKAVHGVPEEYYGMNEFVPLGDNYFYGNFIDGYSIRANDFQFMETEDYLSVFGKTTDDYEWCPERVCLVDVTLRYDEPEQNAAETIDDGEEEKVFWLTDLWIYGTDYYATQNIDFFALSNPEMKDSQGLRLGDGEEYHAVLVFGLLERYYTAYNWNHMDELPMMLYLTGYPVQKNIIFHQRNAGLFSLSRLSEALPA